MKKVIIVSILAGLVGFAHADNLNLQQVFHTKLNKKMKCQEVSNVFNRSYCLTILNEKVIDDTTHTLVGGYPFENGQKLDSHVDMGIVAYVVQKDSQVSVSPFIENGSMGEPSKDWSFISVNNQGFWVGKSEDVNQGMSVTQALILNKKGLINDFLIGVNESGACDTSKCTKMAKDISGTITSNNDTLSVMLQGKNKGKKVNSVYTLTWNEKEGKFNIPSNYLLNQ